MSNTLPQKKGWPVFIDHLARTCKLWLWIIFLLLISRAILMWTNRFSMDEGISLSDFALAFFTGFQFDAPVATIASLPAFLSTCLTLLFPWGKGATIIRAASTYLITILWVIITTVTLVYFHNFHNQFDAHMLGAVHDDLGAVMITLWKSHPIIPGALGLIILCALLLFAGSRWVRAPFPIIHSLKKPSRLISKIVFTLLTLAVIFIALRGTLSHRPIQKKDAARTTHSMLNRCVINPFSSLKYAIQSHQDLMKANGLDHYIDHESPLGAFREYANNPDIKSVDDAFLRTAQGHTGKKPRHIFLIVMESYDGWTMLPQHADWHISDELKKLGQEGIYVQKFLPGSRSTMTSLGTMISGLADAGVITNERSRPGEAPFATAIAAQMKQLGYDTHFWYAGYASWQRIGDFTQEQGFDHIHMATSMGKDADINEWGVSDKHLFSHIRNTFRSDTPTFNMIMTSSNHPPYSLDLKKENCPITSVPAAYQKEFEHGSATLNMLGHHWYSDKWMGDFVRKVSGQTPDCLFAITADHWGRIFPGPRPTQFEKAIVPLVLYGPDILPSDIDADQLSGSHYDLGATLIELAAEPRFQYHAIGQNILTTHKNNVAMSRLWLLGDNFILPATKKNQIETLDGTKLPTSPIDLGPVRRHYNLTHGISWWRLRKGNDLPNK